MDLCADNLTKNFHKCSNQHLCINALKCLKNPRFKDMFPLNNKSHEMQTRIEDKYEVQFAMTNRLKNSPVIYMQKLLNQHELNNPG